MRTGAILFGVYLAAVLLIVLFIETRGSDMSGLLLIFPALPWSLLGNWAFGFNGLGWGMFGGLAINAGLAFGLGWWIERRRRRARSGD
jgi:hypothetical protein